MPASPIPSLLGQFQQLVNNHVPYVWSWAKARGADCSGAVNYVFWRIGYSVGGYQGPNSGHGPATTTQVGYGENVPLGDQSDPLANAQPGDLLFFNEPGEGPNSHVALYAGNGMMYDEPHTGLDAQEVPVTTQYVDDIQRYLDPSTGAPLGSGITGSFTGNPGGIDGSIPATTDPATTTGLVTGGLGKTLGSVAGTVVGVTAGAGLVILGAYKAAGGHPAKLAGTAAKTGAKALVAA